MIIKNGLVFTEEKTFEQKELYIKKGRIVESEAELSEEEREVYDASDCYVIPGLVEVHSHGAVGYDVNMANKEGLKKLLRYERAHGVTSYCPTTMTLPKEMLLGVCQMLRAAVKEQEEALNAEAEVAEEEREARIVGIHLEGPFLEESKRGAHTKEFLSGADASFVRKCMEASGGLVRLMTLAPEVEGNVELIEEMGKEIHFSLGHTKATYETSKKAILAGADHITHLYNGMGEMTAREPGAIGAAKDMQSCYVEVICDGIHVHESMVKLAFDMYKDRMVLVSDSICAAGLEDGEYNFVGFKIFVKNGLATFENGTIVGSVSTLFDCMRHAMEIGIPMEEAVAAATMNPAKSIGIYDEVGSLTPGKRADVLILDRDFELKKVL